MKAAWRTKTAADILNEAQFTHLKTQSRLHILGVLGFAGQWERSLLTGEALTRFIADAHEALQEELVRAQRENTDTLVVATGATNTGVLQLTYEICASLGIPTLSVAPEAALKYELGPIHYLIPSGKEFGDESDLFVQLCDAFILLGGGKQSRREILAAYAVGKPITIIQGFGGTANELMPARLPGARFI